MSLVAAVKAWAGRPVLLNLRPLRDRRADEAGRCVVCGADTTFAFNSWTTPDELHAFWADANVSRAYSRRESMFCRSCCSNLRVRRIAEVLVALYGPPACGSFAELIEYPAFRDLDVAEINTIGSLGSLHAMLQRLPRLMFSEYQGPQRLGEVIGALAADRGAALRMAQASRAARVIDAADRVADLCLAGGVQA